MGKMRSYRMQQACRMFCVVGVLCSVMCGLCSCGWKDAKEVIATAERMDKTEHVVYDDTAAIAGVIRTLDNPLGKLIHKNTLGKAYYYMGRNLEDYHQRVADAAECYIEADRLQIDDPIYRGRVNSCMGYICAQNNNDSLALIFYERASEDFKESGNEWYYAHHLLNVIPCCINLHLFTKTDSLLQIAQLYSLDSAYRARYYETQGLYFYEQQQYDSALVYFNQGLNYWQSEEDKCFSYLKIMQVYFDIHRLDLAISYATLIASLSTNPNHTSNAYYCLIQNAQKTGNVDLVSNYASYREDMNRLLEKHKESYTQAVTIIEDYKHNPYPFRRFGIVISCLLVLFFITIGSIITYRKHTATRLCDVTNRLDDTTTLLHEANEKIENLSTRIKEHEDMESLSKSSYYFNKSINAVRTEFPAPSNKWNDYKRLKKDIDPWLHNWLRALDQLNLAEREKILCIYTLLYPHLSTAKLADYMNYDKDGIRVFKTRMVQKLGIKSSQLPSFLRKLSIKG